MNLTAEDKFILAASRLNLTEKDIKLIGELIPEISDWERLTDIAIQNSIGPLIHKNISSPPYSDLIPEETITRFKNAYHRTLSRNMILYEHFKNAINNFSELGASVMALKGIYFAETFYHDIGLRQMSDIDLLLKEEDVDKCWNILFRKGYKYEDHKKTEFIKSFSEAKHLPSLCMNGVIIELHTKIFLSQYGFSVNMNDCWQRSKDIKLFGLPVKVLSPEHQLQHSCIHLEEHYRVGKPQLFNFIDISALVDANRSSFDWEYLKDSCHSYNCNKAVYKYLFLANKYFSLSIPDHVMSLADTYIDEKTENIFIHYLKNFNDNLPLEFSNPKYVDLKKVKGLKNKTHYLAGDIFPSKKFMYSRYKIKKKNHVYWYYLVRMKTGVFRFFNSIVRKKRK